MENSYFWNICSLKTQKKRNKTLHKYREKNINELLSSNFSQSPKNHLILLSLKAHRQNLVRLNNWAFDD
jgi:hypothetical protein